MGGTASASPIVLTKLKAASNSENIPKKHVSITLPVGKDIPIDLGELKAQYNRQALIRIAGHI